MAKKGDSVGAGDLNRKVTLLVNRPVGEDGNNDFFERSRIKKRIGPVSAQVDDTTPGKLRVTLRASRGVTGGILKPGTQVELEDGQRWWIHFVGTASRRYPFFTVTCGYSRLD
jgi:hypothetical protein